MSGLFQRMTFRSHAGLSLTWKIECDALTVDDWATLAQIVSENISFGSVEGVPRGGLAFARALEPYAHGSGPLLIADDVLTTGQSMEAARMGRDAIGIVAFSRTAAIPVWINVVWILGLLDRHLRK